MLRVELFPHILTCDIDEQTDQSTDSLNCDSSPINCLARIC